MNKKQTIRLNESHLRRIVNESIRKILKEEYNGSFGIIDCLEKYDTPHNLALAIEGAITYIAGIENHDTLSKMAKYIDENMISEQDYTMRDRDF